MVAPAFHNFHANAHGVGETVENPVPSVQKEGGTFGHELDFAFGQAGMRLLTAGAGKPLDFSGAPHLLAEGLDIPPLDYKT